MNATHAHDKTTKTRNGIDEAEDILYAQKGKYYIRGITHHHHHLFYAVHSPTPCCNPYLNMVLYATYYDPMMCCHPMMFE